MAMFKKLAIDKKKLYKKRLDCLTGNGMVSVVFFLIIAYRPLIQSPLLDTAVRLAGEDYYRKAWFHGGSVQPLLTRYSRLRPADHVV